LYKKRQNLPLLASVFPVKTGKKRGKFASFARKEHPNLPAIFAILLFYNSHA
jgi:hypothetical protein